MSLFRQEVFDAKDAQLLGSIRIGRNPGFTTVAIISAFMGGALIAFAVLGEFTRKARLPGLLMPTLGALNITTPQAGTLLDVKVVEGDRVHIGQVLMTLNTDRTTARGDTAVLIAQSLQQRHATLQTERILAQTQAEQRRHAYAERIRGMATEQRQLEGEIEALQRRMGLARKSVERYSELAASGFVADVQAQQRQEELIDIGSRLSSAQRSLTALQRDAEALRAETLANASALQTQLSQIDRSLAMIDQEGAENEARGKSVITAPQAGIVSALTVHAGSAVQVGQTLATVLPQLTSDVEDAEHPAHAALQAELYAPSRTAGFVQAGQSVWLRYAAYPYQKFGMAEGRVESVSRTPINPLDLPPGQGQALLSAAQSNEPLYRVIVSLARQEISTYGAIQVLKSGMALEADVEQDRRAVWEWVLEPVLAIRAQISSSR